MTNAEKLRELFPELPRYSGIDYWGDFWDEEFKEPEKDAVRLIDANALIAQLKTWAGCAECDNYNGVRCRACNFDDAISCVDDFADNHPI